MQRLPTYLRKVVIIMEIDENVHRLANLFRAGGNAIRLQILIRLSDCDSYVSELAELLDRSTSSTSAHLKDLKAVDLVEAETEGRHAKYSIKRQDLVDKLLDFIDLLSRDNDDNK
jgi:DNA-binding transcriptional ArsR family regulator